MACLPGSKFLLWTKLRQLVIWRTSHPCFWNGWRSGEKLDLRAGMLWQGQCLQDPGWWDTLKPTEELCLARWVARTLGQQKRTWGTSGPSWCQEATWLCSLSAGATSPISSTGTRMEGRAGMEGRRPGCSCFTILLRTWLTAVRSAHLSN